MANTNAKTTTKIETPAGDATFEAKTNTAKTADVFGFPTFDANEVTDMYRQFADQATQQTRDTYGRMKTAAEEAQATMETTVDGMQNAGTTIGLKAIDAMRTNAELGLSHLENLMKVKSVSELIELQSSYVRKQTETSADQIKQMQELSTKVAEDVSAPAKAQFDKFTETLKVA